MRHGRGEGEGRGRGLCCDGRGRNGGGVVLKWEGRGYIVMVREEGEEGEGGSCDEMRPVRGNGPNGVIGSAEFPDSRQDTSHFLQ